MATLMQKLTNPLAMLASDHEYVKSVLTRCLNTDSLAVRRVLVQEICDNLVIHATLEEEIFYPALARWGGEEGHRFVEDALREHQEIKQCIAEVQRVDVGGPDFRLRVGRLEEAVVTHAEREEGHFPMAQERLPIRQLAKQMDLRRMQLMAQVRPPSGLAMIGLVLIGLGMFFFLKRQR
ncbi:MAG TPA: hemerythrin domain-containing protein [Nitrospiraceae bacterium]|nr:hemerythrin domain-containing protein [Nitrospiraceae bacterium]